MFQRQGPYRRQILTKKNYVKSAIWLTFGVNHATAPFQTNRLIFAKGQPAPWPMTQSSRERPPLRPRDIIAR
jgi:hypothetical protein